MDDRSRGGMLRLAVFLLIAFAFPSVRAAEDLSRLSKGYRILIQRGLQLQGMVTADNPFHLQTYADLGYTSINWFGPAPVAKQGDYLWARWVSDPDKMPPIGAEGRAMGNLIGLSFRDEANLNDPKIRQEYIDWFNKVRDRFPSTILYHNNYGGQVNDQSLGDFIARAKPDMLCFDTYPFISDYKTHQPLGGPPTGWYSELWRYRAFSMGAHIPFGCYMQTFHAVEDYDQRVYRDPSPSELRLNNFAALAFNAKVLTGFTYNTGASSLFVHHGADTVPTPLFAEQKEVNREAKNLGKALVRLTPIASMHNKSTTQPVDGAASDDPNFPPGTVTNMMFIRGKNSAGDPNGIPISFMPDPQGPKAYSWWEADKNDPYLRGWSVTNKGTKNGGKPGDVIVSWFKPLDESFDGPEFSNEIYMMVVNGLSDPTGSAADCTQEIRLTFDFTSNPKITGITLLDPKSGQLRDAPLTAIKSRKQLVLDLVGGGAALFKFNDGAPFVGISK